ARNAQNSESNMIDCKIISWRLEAESIWKAARVAGVQARAGRSSVTGEAAVLVGASREKQAFRDDEGRSPVVAACAQRGLSRVDFLGKSDRLHLFGWTFSADQGKNFSSRGHSLGR
ncbi:MAG TPA: hypothetical protein VJ719_16375, partial [Chthoniobacterales bacterium]|nr:hypothetical protein [Chthoniobacterales bacterium]